MKNSKFHYEAAAMAGDKNVGAGYIKGTCERLLVKLILVIPS
jgi:hypothetical protein